MLNKDEFEDFVSQRTGVPRQRVGNTSRLTADLGLDSFGLLELAASLAELGVSLDERGWVSVETIGELYDRYRKGIEDGGTSASDGAGLADSGTATATDHVAPLITVGQFFRLVPVLPSAVPFLYDLAISPDVGFRWRYRGSVPSYQQFEQELWQGMLVQFLVESVQTNQPAGHLICYNPDPSLGHAYIGAAMASQYLGTGIAAEPVILFTQYIFDVWPFRKLYMETPEFNYQQFASASGRSLQVEGRLRNHDYYRGRRWDRLVLAAYRPGEGVKDSAEGFRTA